MLTPQAAESCLRLETEPRCSLLLAAGGAGGGGGGGGGTQPRIAVKELVAKVPPRHSPPFLHPIACPLTVPLELESAGGGGGGGGKSVQSLRGGNVPDVRAGGDRPSCIVSAVATPADDDDEPPLAPLLRSGMPCSGIAALARDRKRPAEILQLRGTSLTVETGSSDSPTGETLLSGGTKRSACVSDRLLRTVFVSGGLLRVAT